MSGTNKSKKELIQEIQELKKENELLKSVLHRESIEGIQPGIEKPVSGIKPEAPVESVWNAGTENDRQNISQLFDDYIRMYSSRDDNLTKYFSENFSGFTGGGDFLVKDKTEWVAITRQDFAQVKGQIHIEIKDVAIQTLSDTVAVATGFFKIHLPIKDHILSREIARLVLIFCKETEGWKIAHSSISIPYYLVREGEVYPMKELVDRNEYLEEIIAERTIQLSGINDDLQQINGELEKEIEEHGRALNELRKSEQKYHLLVDSAIEAIVVVQEGRLRLTNPMTKIMTGHSEEELEGASFILFIHPDDRVRVAENHLRRLNGENLPNNYVFRLLNKDGNTRWVYMNAVLIEWEGSPATLNFLTDITERKLAEEALQQSNQKLEAIISASPDGIGMLTLDGKMQFLSDKLLKMYDYTIEERNEIIGKPAFDFIDPSNHQTLTDNLSKLLSGESDHRIKEYVGIRKDRSRFYVDLNYALLLDSTGNPVSILFIERDSTERKRVEAEIKLKNEMLIRADEEKDKFISVIAHDLRSPFYSLLGLTEILATDSSEMTSLEITKYSKSLHESVVNLYTLLEKLLEWAQLQKDSTGFVPRALLLYDIFSESIESVNQKAMHKGITILNEIPKDQKIYADDKMISSVLRNLIFNAIKFTNKGGKIVGTSREIEDGWVEVSVTDTGIGIYKNIMAKLFKLGEKVSTRGTENEPSTGLGLLMCKDFIEKHGGKIWAESEEGKGSTFRFTLRKTGKDIK